VGRSDLTAHLDAARFAGGLAQAYVQHRHVGLGPGDELQRLLGGPGLTDDRDVVLGPQQVAHPPADQLVIVEEEHADGHAPFWPLGGG